MAIVYVIADTLARKTEAGTETRIFMRSVAGADDPDEAYELFINEFESSKEAGEGWEMVGAPGKLDVNAQTLAQWQEHVSDAEVVPFSGLHVVE